MYCCNASLAIDDLYQSESAVLFCCFQAEKQWVNLFPEIKEHLINIFERYTHVLDAELQQRACEYLALATRNDNDELLATLCDEMPVFPERESALVSRLHKRGETAQDKRTWVIGGKEENKGREAERFKGFRRGTGDSASILASSQAVTSQSKQPPPATSASAASSAKPSLPIDAPLAARPSAPERQVSLAPEPMMGTTSSGPADDIMASLAELDMSGNNVQDEPLLPDANGDANRPTHIPEGAADRATLGGVDPWLLVPLTAGPNVEKVIDFCASPQEFADQ